MGACRRWGAALDWQRIKSFHSTGFSQEDSMSDEDFDTPLEDSDITSSGSDPVPGGGDADGTDGGDADGTDGDGSDGTDGDASDGAGSDGGDADGTDGTAL
jgi:hypothetical protein